jgi:hypothetical protein
VTLPARVRAHAPQLLWSPSHYFLPDLIGHVLPQSPSWGGLSTIHFPGTAGPVESVSNFTRNTPKSTCPSVSLETCHLRWPQNSCDPFYLSRLRMEGIPCRYAFGRVCFDEMKSRVRNLKEAHFSQAGTTSFRPHWSQPTKRLFGVSTPCKNAAWSATRAINTLKNDKFKMQIMYHKCDMQIVYEQTFSVSHTTCRYIPVGLRTDWTYIWRSIAINCARWRFFFVKKNIRKSYQPFQEFDWREHIVAKPPVHRHREAQNSCADEWMTSRAVSAVWHDINQSPHLHALDTNLSNYHSICLLLT